MYLRTTTRRNADGSKVQYYQLAENVWDPKRRCAVPKVVHSFGRADQVDEAKMRRLAKSILRVFGGEEEVRDQADVRMIDSWPSGGAWALDRLWHELGIDQVLVGKMTAENRTQPFERALFSMVANRALHGYSKLYCWDQWLREEVYLPDAGDLELHHLYGAMDFLERNKPEVEKEVYWRMADLLNADVDLIFYDTTSLHFEVDEEDEGDDEGMVKGSKAAGAQEYKAPRKRGKSKNGRGDAPQVVVGLAVTRDGLPVRSWVFPGNTMDATTVAQVKKDLQGWRLGRCVFVGDAGMNSEDNRRELALGGGKYILATKMRAGDEVTKDVLTRPGRYHEVAGNLRVKEVIVGDGERRHRYVVCHNPAEEERQKRHRERLLELAAAELATLKAPKPGEPHSKRTCELLTSERFGKYLRRGRGGRVEIDRAAIKREERLDGKWVVTTNDDTLTPEDMALGYKQLLQVEDCWRMMKTGMRMRPIYHWAVHRIHAHVTLCALALLLTRMAENRANDTWRNIASRLQTIKVVEYERDGSRIHQTTDVRPEVKQLLKTLKVPEPPKILAIRPVQEPAPEPAPDA
jgi:hypothetical protein